MLKYIQDEIQSSRFGKTKPWSSAALHWYRWDIHRAHLRYPHACEQQYRALLILDWIGVLDDVVRIGHLLDSCQMYGVVKNVAALEQRLKRHHVATRWKD